MALRPYLRHIEELDQDPRQDRVDEFARQLDVKVAPGAAARLFAGKTLTAGVENLLEHGLGKAVSGWRIVDINVPAFVWRVTTSTAPAARYLSLGVSATAVVSIEVF
jgi:hypothetical protein